MVKVMLLILQIHLSKAMKSIVDLRKQLMQLIIILLMLVHQSLQTFHMSMKVSMTENFTFVLDVTDHIG